MIVPCLQMTHGFWKEIKVVKYAGEAFGEKKKYHPISNLRSYYGDSFEREHLGYHIHFTEVGDKLAIRWEKRDSERKNNL